MYYRLFRYFFCLVCILFVISCSKDSQIESFHIKAEVDTTKATIGDIVSLRIIAEESDGLHLSFPDMDIRIPAHVVLQVTDTEPGFKGNTATGATKPATLETGFIIQVPLFVSSDDKIKIDTRTGQYIERAK